MSKQIEEVHDGDIVQCAICGATKPYTEEAVVGTITHSEDGQTLECVECERDAAARETAIENTWSDAWQAYRTLCGANDPSISEQELHQEYLDNPTAPRYGEDWSAWLSAAWDRHEQDCMPSNRTIDRPELDGYQSDARLLEAIEAITGGDLTSEDRSDPAIKLWDDGGREDEIRAWLDAHYPDWRQGPPLLWGHGELDVE